MRMTAFAVRNRKEILRDPLNLAFGIGFPLVILLLFSAIQANIPQQDVFGINKMAPGVAVFGLSFVSLFSGTLVSKDRTTSFLMRLFASPLSSSDYILGYALPLLPISLAQAALSFLTAFFLGLKPSINVVLALVVLIPTSVLFIGFGLLAGTLLTDKQVGGICGALLTNVSALLGGAWFDLKMVGGAIETIAYLLPFAHAVDATKAAITGDFALILPHLLWVVGYAVVVFLLAITVFRKKMKN